MKFDWAKMAGFKEDMTAEERLALLESYEPEEKTVPKAQFDKLTSELAAANKALKSKMTEDEAKEAERQKEFADMQAELEALKHEKTVSNYRASLLGLKMDEKSAGIAAEALASGKIEEVFGLLKTHSEGLEKSIRAEIMKDTPRPPAGTGGEGKKLTAAEEFAKSLAAEHKASADTAKAAENYYFTGGNT